MMPAFVTERPWPRTQDHYGWETTYALAADWLADCPFVSDWGGANGHLGEYLPASTHYTVVDGTSQTLTPRVGKRRFVLANLETYHVKSPGIALRHVLDNTASDWRVILRNALDAFTKRLVVVTFTPAVAQTRRIEKKNGWPVWQFNPQDLIAEMGDLLVRHEDVPTSHPEHVYYLERP